MTEFQADSRNLALEPRGARLTWFRSPENSQDSKKSRDRPALRGNLQQGARQREQKHSLTPPSGNATSFKNPTQAIVEAKISLRKNQLAQDLSDGFHSLLRNLKRQFNLDCTLARAR
jgi:hypothetical protein